MSDCAQPIVLRISTPKASDDDMGMGYGNGGRIRSCRCSCMYERAREGVRGEGIFLYFSCSLHHLCSYLQLLTSTFSGLPISAYCRVACGADRSFISNSNIRSLLPKLPTISNLRATYSI